MSTKQQFIGYDWFEDAPSEAAAVKQRAEDSSPIANALGFSLLGSILKALVCLIALSVLCIQMYGDTYSFELSTAQSSAPEYQRLDKHREHVSAEHSAQGHSSYVPRQKMILAAADAYKLDWRLLAAVLNNETDFGRSQLPGVSSGLNSVGCCAGPAQFCVVSSCGNTFDAYGKDGDADGSINVYDIDDATLSMANMLNNLRQQFGNNPRLLMAAYNAGPGNVSNYGGVPPFDETELYVKNGMKLIRSLPRL